MSVRFQTIAALCTPCGCLGDIGCDHGYIGLWMLRSGICTRTLEIDISAPSLQKARGLFAKQGYADRAEFCLGDGLRCAKGADAAVIAGMGGKLIGRILEDSFSIARQMDYLVLQPNGSVPYLRDHVTRSGFVITDEAICFENGRFYAVLRVEGGRSVPLTELELELGPINLGRNAPILKEYAGYRLKVHRSILSTMEAGTARGAAYFASQRMAALLEEYLEHG